MDDMDSKARAYVFGCGQYFEKKQAGILEKYEIEAVLDNNKTGEIELLNGKQVPILKPIEAVQGKNTEIPIIIMVYDFYSAWKELEALSAAADRIIFPNTFCPLTEEEEKIRLDGGEFRIEEGVIWYISAGKRCQIDSRDSICSFFMWLERNNQEARFLTEQASVKPLNRKFGFSRGTPIDRYYIENWLMINRECIRGDVLEIAENTYTKRFGKENVVSHILHVNMENEGWIKGNLETGEGIAENTMDCIILTQTLPFIYDVRQVITNVYKMLRIGGTALITAGGITQISRYDMDQWGHFWSFTDASLKRLLEESPFEKNYDISVYGNVKAACALLYGMAAEELTEEELAYEDEDYPVSICAVVRK